MSAPLGGTIPIRITADDKTAEVRKLTRAVGNAVSQMIMQTWLSEGGSYDIDVDVTMRGDD